MIWFILTVFIAYAFLFAYKTKTGSPYLPSTPQEIELALSYLKPGVHLADLGAGDGRLLFAALKRGAQEAWGWEIEPLIWLKGILKTFSLPQAQRKKLHLILGDMYRADLSKFDVIFIYQLERFNKRLAQKIKHEARPGTLVIANKYQVPSLTLKTKNHHLFVYEV